MKKRQTPRQTNLGLGGLGSWLARPQHPGNTFVIWSWTELWDYCIQMTKEAGLLHADTQGNRVIIHSLTRRQV